MKLKLFPLPIRDEKFVFQFRGGLKRRYLRLRDVFRAADTLPFLYRVGVFVVYPYDFGGTPGKLFPLELYLCRPDGNVVQQRLMIDAEKLDGVVGTVAERINVQRFF